MIYRCLILTSQKLAALAGPCRHFKSTVYNLVRLSLNYCQTSWLGDVSIYSSRVSTGDTSGLKEDTHQSQLKASRQEEWWRFWVSGRTTLTAVCLNWIHQTWHLPDICANPRRLCHVAWKGLSEASVRDKFNFHLKKKFSCVPIEVRDWVWMVHVQWLKKSSCKRLLVSLMVVTIGCADGKLKSPWKKIFRWPQRCPGKPFSTSGGGKRPRKSCAKTE